MKNIISFVMFTFCVSLNAQNDSTKNESRLTCNVYKFFLNGHLPGSNSLALPDGAIVPKDFKSPPLNAFGIELGFRYSLIYNQSKMFSLSANTPLQLGVNFSTGPLSSQKKSNPSFWMALPVLLSANFGLGTSKAASNKRFGYYFGAGAALNKDFIHTKEYTFNLTPSGPVNYSYRYNFFPTVNAIAGIQWKWKRERKWRVKDKVRHIGFMCSIGKNGAWYVGFTGGN
jgi:hypothetical protein